MLQITIPGNEYFDEVNELFVATKEQTLQLEHSLVSLSKWESKWQKPFLGREPKTLEESIDYIRCMTVTQNVNPLTYNDVTDEVLAQVNAYIDAPMTATWFSNKNRKPNNEIITAELVYYWMITLTIPLECQKWHFNRLMTLIQVCNVKNAPQKKTSKKETLNRNKTLNDARKQKLQTSG